MLGMHVGHCVVSSHVLRSGLRPPSIVSSVSEPVPSRATARCPPPGRGSAQRVKCRHVMVLDRPESGVLHERGIAKSTTPPSRASRPVASVLGEAEALIFEK